MANHNKTRIIISTWLNAANEETGRSLMQANVHLLVIFLQLYMFLPSTYYTLIG